MLSLNGNGLLINYILEPLHRNITSEVLMK